jgi:hypothetical protein
MLNLTNGQAGELSPGGLISILSVDPAYAAPFLDRRRLRHRGRRRAVRRRRYLHLERGEGQFARVFDASVARLPASADIDAFAVVDADTFYVSFNGNAGTNVPGLGVVGDEDVLLYEAAVESLLRRLGHGARRERR